MKPSRWWLVLFPLLYLPNLGFGRQTAFGVLEISDFLIGPYILLVLVAARKQGFRQYQRLTPFLLTFFAVAFVSTLTIPLRYSMASGYPMTFGLLKLAKLALYGMAGVLTARALALDVHRPRYDWAVLAAAVVVAIAMMTMPEEVGRFSYSETKAGYKATNAISAMMAILLVYLVGRVVQKANSRNWHRLALWALPLIGLGFMLSKGRGGWVAALMGFGFLFYRQGLRRQVVLTATIILLTGTLAYNQYPGFRDQVDMTLWPDQSFLDRYNAGIAGIDDGARITTWAHEIAKLPNAPVVGTGFFHRGGASPLWTTGSHNFWLQMLLETGVLGFGCLIWAVCRMWKQTKLEAARRLRLSLPVQSAFIAAFAGGLSGEYFYGGMVLFTLFAVYAPVGGLAAPVRQSRPSSRRAHSHRLASP